MINKAISLAVLSTISLGALILIAWFFSSWRNTTRDQTQTEICTTSDCFTVAERFILNLKPSIDPCDNFYNFACGSLLDKEPFTITCLDEEDSFKNRLMNVIGEERKTSEPKYFRIPKRFYEICMRSTNISRNDIRSYIKILNALDIPFVKGDSWNSDGRWSLNSAMKVLRDFGYETNHFISVRVYNVDDFKYSLLIDMPEASYSVYSMKVFGALSPFILPIVKNSTTFHDDLLEALDFQYELSKIAGKHSEEHSEKRIQDLQNQFPFLNWLDYLNGLMPKDIHLSEDESILVSDLESFEKLGLLLKNTSNKIIANFIAFHVIEESVNRLPHHVYARVGDALGQHILERKDKCIQALKDSVGPLVLFLYSQKYSIYKAQKAFQNVFQYVKTSMKSFIENSSHEEETKKVLKSRIQQIKLIPGYPIEFDDRNFLDSMYKNVAFDKTFLGFHLSLNRALKDYELSSLNGRHHTFLTDADSNRALFERNKILIYSKDSIQLGLTLPFLDGSERIIFQNAPLYVNLATCSWLLTSIVMDAIFDVHEPMQNDTGATDPTQRSEDYLKKINCLSKQYEQFEDESTGIKYAANGSVPYSVADNEGLSIAHEAYQTILLNDRTKSFLPRVKNFTADQLFWILSAQSYCEYYTEDEKDSCTQKNLPLNNFRVLGSFQNNKIFSKNFKCGLETKMNPKDKCEFL